MSDANRCVICGEIIPEGSQVCPDCVEKWLTPKDGDFWMINIPEGCGRFFFRIQGEDSAIVFAVCERKVELGVEVDVSQDKDKSVPIIGMIVQSPKKARAIANAFNRLAEKMEKENKA